MTNEIERLENMIAGMQENNRKVLIVLERIVTLTEDHQKRIGRLEQLLVRKEKKVSKLPGDREA